jgi:hypothetical protein
MWVINVLLLWLAPLTLGLLVFNRMDRGAAALTDIEHELLFDETQVSQVTPWLGIKFAALAGVFFVIGLLEGVILPNLGFIWNALSALLTGSAIILLVALWLRSGSDAPWQLRSPRTGAKHATYSRRVH